MSKPFVGVKFSGRLGNCVFQMMTTMAHAWRNGADYKFPEYSKTKYDKKVPFDYFPKLTTEDEARIEFEHRQDGWTFEPLPYKPNMRLAGWYQNINYFDEYRKELIEAFNLPKEKIDAVCVHVRRGDYAKYPTKWPILDRKYYSAAYLKMSFLAWPEMPIHIFSDEDSDDVRRFSANEYFLAGDPLEDWLRMSTYKYHIIANSTFSWTSAYLSGSDDVIAPHFSDWYGISNSHIYTGELIPETWKQIKINL